MNLVIAIEPPARQRELLEVRRDGFEAAWPARYGPGGRGSALQDLQAFANAGGRLPVGVVAFRGDAVCGVAALKAGPSASHAHLSPWAAAGLVRPDLRRQGIGSLLPAALERHARRLGFDAICCGTIPARRRLQRSGWAPIEAIVDDRKALGIYRKALEAVPQSIA